VVPLRCSTTESRSAKTMPSNGVGKVRLLTGAAESALIHALGNRLRDTQNAIPSTARLLPYPLRNARFVLNELTDELSREIPHLREFGHGEMTLLEGC
jgi:hypothetical protein